MKKNPCFQKTCYENWVGIFTDRDSMEKLSILVINLTIVDTKIIIQ